MKKLNGIQETIHRVRGHKGIYLLEKNTQQELTRVLHQEELNWFLRDKSKWLVEGDRNIIFYHVKAVQMRTGKIVNMIKNCNGDWIEDPAIIEEMFRECYHNIYTTDIEVGNWLQTRVIFSSMSESLLEVSQGKLTTKEIKEQFLAWLHGSPHGLMATQLVSTKTSGALLVIVCANSSIIFG